MSLIIESIYGECPVQADGLVDGKIFYFRSRGNRWSMTIDANFYYEEPYGDEPFVAGRISEEEARNFINKAVEIYRNSHA